MSATTYTADATGTLTITLKGLAAGARYAVETTATLLPPPPPPPGVLSLKLSADRTGVEIATLPAGAVEIELGYAPAQVPASAVGNVKLPLPLAAPFVPPAAAAWVRGVALDAAGKELGGWMSQRIQTTPAHVEPAPEPEPTTGFMPGLHFNGWGHEKWKDIATTGVKFVRLPWGEATNPLEASEAQKNGICIASVVDGEGGSIGGIDPHKYLEEQIAYFDVYGRGGSFWKDKPADLGTIFDEILNEPNGSWFWSDPANYAAYENLCKVVFQGFAAHYAPAIRPKVAASYGSHSFWEGDVKAGILPYTDVVVVHAYGGASGGSGGAEGNRKQVREAHEQSGGKHIIVTEIGWPTALGQSSTGDSQQWTEAQQAENITAFMHWAKSTGYIDFVSIFGYVDGGGNNAYGVERRDRTHKPGFAAITS